MEIRSVIIIGSGPAGWTAGIYAARAGLAPLLFEGEATAENTEAGRAPMGQLSTTNEVENYPGFPRGNWEPSLTAALNPDRLSILPPIRPGAVTGPALVELMREQAIAQGLEIRDTDIVAVDFSTRPFPLTDSTGRCYHAQSVIVATGASAKRLGLPSEARFKNRGVSTCAVCDGPLPRFRNKPIAVVGGGDSAVEEALYLSRFGSVIYLIHRRNEFRASRVMMLRAESEPKIQILRNRVVQEVLGTDQQGVTGVVLASTAGEPDLTLEISGLFPAIGHTPNVSFLKRQLRLTSAGFIERPIPFQTATSVPGVFAAGDVADARYRQAITAAAGGCMAALDAERFLQTPR
jgi:thioredoxin reductase (NADPH)